MTDYLGPDTGLRLPAGSASDATNQSQNASSQPEQNHNLLSLFCEGVVHSLEAPLVGIEQLSGNQQAADNYLAQNDTANATSLEKGLYSAGSLLGNAALFIGASEILKGCLPCPSAVAPIAVGAGLGFVEPVGPNAGIGTRIGQAGISAASLLMMNVGPKALTSLGIGQGLGQDLAKIGISGMVAGTLGTEASTYLQTGQWAKPSDALLGGLAWAGTGMAFHLGETALCMSNPIGIGKPSQGEVKLIGDRYSNESYSAREFLKKNYVPYTQYDPAKNMFARIAMQNAGIEGHPAVELSDGTIIAATSPEALAKGLGIPTTPSKPAYDVVVVGAGPAGLESSIYSSSEGLNTLLVDGMGPGGQAGTTSRVENVLGFPEGVSGPELTEKAFEQTSRLGTEFVLNKVTNISRGDDGTISVSLSDGSQVKARSVVLATGVQAHEMPNVDGLDQLKNRGVYYGAGMTEAALTKPGENIVIVGGANSAGQAAVNYADRVGPTGSVTILARSPIQNDMSQYLIDQIKQRPNISVQENKVVAAVDGDDQLRHVLYTDKPAPGAMISGTEGQWTSQKADSMFIFIGSGPNNSWLPDSIKLDDKGFIVTGDRLMTNGQWTLGRHPFNNETSTPGIFAAGDVQSGTPKRIITAAGEGANSIAQVHQYLKQPEAAPALDWKSPVAGPVAPHSTSGIRNLWSLPTPPDLDPYRSGVLWAGQSVKPNVSLVGSLAKNQDTNVSMATKST